MTDTQMTREAVEALLDEVEGHAICFRGHPDIQDQTLRLLGTSETCTLHEVLADIFASGDQVADALRALLATMTELEQVKGERDAAQRDAHGWKVQLGKIASLVPISQIVRVTGTTKDLIEWLTDRVAVAERATAAEAANAALTARSEALVVANRALKPFADRVFNDNGDCTISDTHTLTPADYWNAQIAERVSSDALSADAAKA